MKKANRSMKDLLEITSMYGSTQVTYYNLKGIADDHYARIAELTAHLECVRQSYDVCYAENEKLTAEVAKYRAALAGIASGVRMGPNDSYERAAWKLSDMAAKALKEGK